MYTVKVDKHGYIWIGTMKGYIQRLNPETGQFDTILYRPGEFFVRDMYYDKDSTLYVATKGGLIIIDTETQAYNIYAEAGRFKENNMLTVYKDSRDASLDRTSTRTEYITRRTTPSTSLTRKTDLPPTSSEPSRKTTTTRCGLASATASHESK